MMTLEVEKSGWGNNNLVQFHYNGSFKRPKNIVKRRVFNLATLHRADNFRGRWKASNKDFQLKYKNRKFQFTLISRNEDRTVLVLK